MEFLRLHLILTAVVTVFVCLGLLGLALGVAAARGDKALARWR